MGVCARKRVKLFPVPLLPLLERDMNKQLTSLFLCFRLKSPFDLDRFARFVICRTALSLLSTLFGVTCFF